MLCESMCNPAQAALPTDLRAHLEARIASGALELPILPHVASQVLALSTSDDANARGLAELLIVGAARLDLGGQISADPLPQPPGRVAGGGHGSGPEAFGQDPE